MPPTLSFLETLARKAGDILREGLQNGFQVTFKGEVDLVTEVDHRSEEFLIGEITRQFPTHRIVAEESGITQGEGSGTWFIDPLDGTVNYAHGVPFFAVSVAYHQDGQTQLGVVYDPMRDECYSAERGQGATLNGHILKVSPQTNLEHSLLVTGFPYDIRSNPNNNLDHYTNFSLRSQAVRRLGSAALDLCYVAAGRFDGFWEIRIKPYDIAAGGLVAEEAGARVTTVQGDAEYLHSDTSILAAPPPIHQQMLELLNT